VEIRPRRRLAAGGGAPGDGTPRCNRRVPAAV